MDLKSTFIEHRTLKPPGSSRFQRKKEIEESSSVLFTSLAVHDVSTICQQLLVDGFVQSYVDFYHLTHRMDPFTHEQAIQTQIHTSPEDMVFIRDNLVQAEISRRQGDTPNVYGAFNKLAEFYVDKHDYKTGIFFHDKCLEVAQLTNDIRAEMSANHSLGSIHQAVGNFDSAREFHERHEELAVSVDLGEEISQSNVELYKVYMVLSLKQEGENNLDIALEMYFKALEAAKKSWDKSAEGEVNGKIGKIYLTKGLAQESLPFLQEQSKLATDLGNAEARCKASSALALALDSLGLPERALNELTLVNSISEQSGDAYLQAQACRALGTLYSKVGKLDAAVEVLQKHFSLLKGILYKATAGGGDAATHSPPITSRDLDLARSFIGIARGNLVMSNYVIALQFDIASLLDWKLNRTDLPRNNTSIPTNLLTYVSSGDAVTLNRPVVTTTAAGAIAITDDSAH